jgi:hypothetical protein
LQAWLSCKDSKSKIACGNQIEPSLSSRTYWVKDYLLFINC